MILSFGKLMKPFGLTNMYGTKLKYAAIKVLFVQY
jgi:hypothetical protein